MFAVMGEKVQEKACYRKSHVFNSELNYNQKDKMNYMTQETQCWLEARTSEFQEEYKRLEQERMEAELKGRLGRRPIQPVGTVYESRVLTPDEE
jgi:hypothetical protein